MGKDNVADDSRPAKAYCWRFGSAEFDEARWQLSVAGQDVELEHKPLEVLQYLLRHAGEAVTKEELLSSVWAGRVVVEAVLTNAVGKLRRALGDEAQDIVATLPKVGYRLAAPVSRKAVEFLPGASLLGAGDTVPRRPNWKLETPLARTEGNEVWLARHAKTREARVFKFSLDGRRLSGLKREVTVGRLLEQALGQRADFVRIIDWDFEQAPYFVEFEYGGVGLDRWTDEQGQGIGALPLETRLKLFAEATEAVAAAHDVGVLHKDLKPANLLVYGGTGDWHLRVADFGSSRIFEGGHLDALGITGMGLTQTQLPGTEGSTPLYLAPELAAGQSPMIKSDIYALGVTLYQMVVGDFRRPLAPGWEDEVADPLLREDIADAANGDPAGRLESAASLAERIRTLNKRREQRALEEAVRARIADGERRLARVRARRPWVVAASLLLLGGLTTTVGLLVQIRASEHQATSQRDVALALNRFLAEDILASANPLEVGRHDVTMREALEAAAPEIDERFASQPEVAAPLHATVGRAFYGLSDYASAQAHFQKAGELFSRLQGSGSAAAIEQRVQQAQAAARAGRTEVARGLLSGLEEQIDLLAPEWRTRERIRFDLAHAWIEFEEANFLASVKPLEHAAGLLALLPEPDPALEMEVNQALMMARGYGGVPVGDAARLQEETLAGMQATQAGTKMPRALSIRYALLRIRSFAGESRVLEPEYRKVIAELTDMMGPRNEATLLATHGLAHIHYKQGKWAECRRVAERAHRELGALLGPGHLDAINSANTLGACLLGEGRVAEAAEVFQHALDAMQSGAGVRAGLVRTAVQINYAHVLAEAGRWDDLEALLADIRSSGAKLLDASDDAAGEVALSEGRLLAGRGDIGVGRERLREGVDLLSRKNPPEYWLIRLGQRELAALGEGAEGVKRVQ